ncbi:MAG TPA: peptide deformylase, partial [Vicinamibacterales bacterium]|nr:peptide deformylase [Vicinamibacterales bacterium]
MAILKVAKMGHPILRARARAVEPSEILSPRIQTLIDDMVQTMREYDGVGLAAPQVHEDVRLFVAGIPAGAPGG